MAIINYAESLGANFENKFCEWQKVCAERHDKICLNALKM